MITESISQRDATSADQAFLARLYTDTRRQEVSAWGWPTEQQEWFLRMQFEARQVSYRTSFPNATDCIVLREDKPIGRILTNQEGTSMRLIDIALIEEYRQQGIGSHLLRRVLQQCQKQGLSLHLQVAQGNPAVRLYQRLGFLQTGADAMYVQMEWPLLISEKELC